jgi:hypothetical protein
MAFKEDDEALSDCTGCSEYTDLDHFPLRDWGHCCGGDRDRVNTNTVPFCCPRVATYPEGRSMSALAPNDQQQRLFAPHVLFNNNTIYNVKFISSCFIGAVAGILGLENWLGFIFFIFTTLFTALILYFFNLKTNPKKFFQGGLLEAVNPGQENTFSFILVWTLFYG